MHIFIKIDISMQQSTNPTKIYKDYDIMRAIYV